MARKAEGYIWRLKRSLGPKVRGTTHESDCEAKEEAAEWLGREVDEVDWDVTNSGTLIRASEGPMDIEIQRFPIQAPDLPIQRKGPT